MSNDFNWKSYCIEYYKEKQKEQEEREKIYFIKKSSKERKKEWQQLNKEKIKISRKKYSKSIKGKLSASKTMDYRYRNLNSILLNEWFEGCERHHINSRQIICIPKEMHRKFYHNHKKIETMISINRIAFQYLTDTIKQL